VRAEAEQATAEAVAALRAEAERNAAQVTARLRAEVEQASAGAAARVREEAEQEIEAERQRGIAVLDTERERWQAEVEAERQRATQALDAERRRLDVERQAERQRYEADRVAERQRFDSERQHFRVERQRFEAERQQFAIERDRLTEEARAAVGPLAAVAEAAPAADAEALAAAVADAQAQAAAAAAAQERAADAAAATVMAAQKLSQVETELESEREHVARLNEALQNANDSLRNIGTALERERQERAADHAARTRAEEAIAATASVTTARAAERDAQLASVERLLAALRSLDAAGSLTQILDSVVQAAAAEAPRAALFIVSGDELQGLKASGFEHVDIGTERLPSTGDGLLALALDRREAVASSEVTDAVVPEFALLPADRAALAVPLTIGGEPVAVLYADDGLDVDQHTAPASWPEAVQILVSHAAACLAHLTAMRTAQAMRYATIPSNDEGSAKRYARLLVSEIKLYHEAAVRVGRENRDLMDRLRPEIDRARKLYEERVPATTGERHTFFQQELVRTLADGNAALLGEPA
jgi:SWI/SNF-related matrix-associated actin-dependent regulator 1 of chromatin subfamily A